MSQPNQHSLNVCVVEKRPPAFLRLKDAAADLACSRGHIRNLIAAGKVKATNIDGLMRIKASDWDAYINGAE